MPLTDLKEEIDKGFEFALQRYKSILINFFKSWMVLSNFGTSK